MLRELDGLNAWEFIGFMVFSTLESFALYSFIISVFRYKTSEFAWHILFLALLINLQSFLLRTEFSLSFIVPAIVVIIFIVFFKVIVGIPLVWSAISTVMGYGFYVSLQSIVIALMFGSVSNITSVVDGYAVQSVTSIITLVLAFFLYRLGLGFSFDFERLRFKFEDVAVFFTIALFFIFVSILFYINQIWINILFFAVIAGYLAYYAIKKENES